VWSRSTVVGCVLIAIAALLAGFSLLASANEYVRVFGDDMANVYDCDGPGSVLLLSVPSFLLAIAGMIVSFRAFRGRRSIAAAGAIVVGLVVLSVLLARTPGTFAEMRKNAAPHSPCR
jgi:hypothetical protein